MIEYRDGSTSEIDELNEIMEQFMNEVDEADEGADLADTPAALHVGSEEELEAKKEEKSLSERLDELESKVEKAKLLAKGSSPRGSNRVAMPSPEEVVEFSDERIIQ